jgi:SAM-dependent methyltransferase
LANEFPKSKFYGIDISPISPAGSALPPPAHVVQLDLRNIAKTLSYPDNFFDYIHQRLLVTALTSEDWNNVLKELFRVLKPGGYIELAELSFFDLTDVGPYMEKYLKGCMYDFTQKCIQEAKFLPPIALISFGARDIPKILGTELEDRLLKAGFVNEVLQVTPLPLNHDGKGGELLW